MKKEDRSSLRDTLEKSAPYLRVVTINGSEVSDASIEPVHQSAYDHQELFKILDDIDYSGIIAVQGYGIEGEHFELIRKDYEYIRLKSKPLW